MTFSHPTGRRKVCKHRVHIILDQASTDELQRIIFFFSMLWCTSQTTNTRLQQTCYSPKMLLSVLQTACVRTVRFLNGFFVDAQIPKQKTVKAQIPKQKTVKGHFFCHSSCKKCAWTHIFNHTDALQTWHTMTLGHLYFVYIYWKSFWSKTAEHFLQKKCTVCAAIADANTSLLEWLLSDRSLFSWFFAFFLFFGFVQPLVTDSFEFKPIISEDD